MNKLIVNIDEKKKKLYNIKENELEFDSFRKKIINQLARDAMDKCLEISLNNELSNMTLENINLEINNARKEAKNSH